MFSSFFITFKAFYFMLSNVRLSPGGEIMTGKKITSPRNHTDYELRERTTKYGRRGQIKGVYKKSK